VHGVVPATHAADVSTAAQAVVPSGPVFNNPITGGAAARRVIARVEHAIDSAPAGSTIRIATYSFRVQSTADKLRAAARRGVRVRVVVNGSTNPSGPLLDGLRRAGATVVRTRGTARTRGEGNMHVKMYLFSQSGDSRHVGMVGSANLATGNIGDMWTDLYTSVGHTGIYDEMVRLHNELMRDQPVDPPYRRVTRDPYQLTVFPHPGTDSSTDDIAVALQEVEPAGAVVRVSMYTWGDRRGEDLARALVDLCRSGADVAVVHNGVSAAVRRILDDGGVPRHDSRLDVDGDGVKDHYVHHKYLLVAHPEAGEWHTYTGSHNWGNGSLRRADEVLLRIAGRDTFEAYMANFADVVSSAPAA
jgi:phosphatidylserine/phosphatidylglycerophosphate/cardiolipin synthase-like enzyme